MSEHAVGADPDPIFVIGAGPSGLAAAYRLHQAGRRVVVLEANDRVGGQLLSIQRDGFLMEAGTTILPEAYGSVMQLVQDLGMADELIPANSLMGFLRDGQMHYLRADKLALDAARTKLLSLRSKLKVAKLVLDTWKLRKLLSYEDLSAAGEYDVETPAEYCKRRGLDGELYDYLIEPTVRGGAGVPAEVISVVEFFFLWQKVLGTKLYAFRDGYSSFPQRLAAALPDVRLNCRAVQVVEIGIGSNAGVEVTYDGPNGLVTEGLFAVILEHNKAPGRAPEGKGLISLFFMNQWAVDRADATDEEISEAALTELEKILPGVREEAEFSRINRWYPVLVYSHPGLYRKLGEFHASRDLTSRIHLAGSYNSSGNVNTATTAGERAARELLVALNC